MDNSPGGFTKVHGIIDAHAAHRHRVSVGLEMSWVVRGDIDRAVCKMLVIYIYT